MKTVQEFSKAPISEVVFGITFKRPVFDHNFIIFEIINKLKDKALSVSYKPPIANEFLRELRLEAEADQKASGPVRYFIKQDKNWATQLQLNKFILNWTRGDNEAIGNYPGFGNIKDTFKNYLEKIAYILNQKDCKLEFNNDILYYELLYQDRIDWHSSVKEFENIDSIFNLKTPVIPVENDAKWPKIISNRYITPINSTDYAIININSGISIDGKPILIFECNIRGLANNKDMEEWFEQARKIQNNLFKSIFTSNAQSLWK